MITGLYGSVAVYVPPDWAEEEDIRVPLLMCGHPQVCDSRRGCQWCNDLEEQRANYEKGLAPPMRDAPSE